MVNFNNKEIETLQLFKNFIVFIVSRRSDTDSILRGNGRQSSRSRIFKRFSSDAARHLTIITMKNSNFIGLTQLNIQRFVVGQFIARFYTKQHVK